MKTEKEGEKKETKTTTKKKGDADEAKAEAAAVVLRMELHCHGCALKVSKAIKGAQGAERVTTDVAAGTVTVAGKPDPWDLKDRIQARINVHVAFVSPPNPPPPDKKQIPPPESTVVLSIQLHCKGCTDRIKCKANTIQGVNQVTVDTAKEQVTVKGTMDAKALPDILSAKLKRRVTAVNVVVPPTTNKNKQDKKKNTTADADGGGDDNREHGEANTTAAGGAKKKNKNCKQQQQRGEAAAAAGDDKMASEEQQYQYPYPTIFPPSYGRGGSVGSSYRVQLLQGPLPFSDENPNACSLM